MRGMFLSSLVVFGFRHALLSGTIFIIPPVHPRKQPIMRTFLLPVQRQPTQFFRHTKNPEHGSGLRSYPFSSASERLSAAYKTMNGAKIYRANTYRCS